MSAYKFYPESGEPIDAELERWRWEAIYTDGTSLCQFEDGNPFGTFHQFKDIDQSKVFAFRMVSDEAPSISMIIPSGAKLIHFYRNAMLDVGGPNSTRVRLYCFGYQLGSTKVMTVILPDNSIAIVDDVDKVTVTS